MYICIRLHCCGRFCLIWEKSCDAGGGALSFVRGGGLIRIPKSSIRRYMHFGEGYTIIPDYGILTPGSVFVKGHMHFGKGYYNTKI